MSHEGAERDSASRSQASRSALECLYLDRCIIGSEEDFSRQLFAVAYPVHRSYQVRGMNRLDPILAMIDKAHVAAYFGLRTVGRLFVSPAPQTQGCRTTYPFK